MFNQVGTSMRRCAPVCDGIRYASSSAIRVLHGHRPLFIALHRPACYHFNPHTAAKSNRSPAFAQYSEQDNPTSTIEELFTSKFGASVVDRALRSNASYDALLQHLQNASPEDQARFHEYAKSMLSSVELPEPNISEYINASSLEAAEFSGDLLEQELQGMRASLLAQQASTKQQPFNKTPLELVEPEVLRSTSQSRSWQPAHASPSYQEEAAASTSQETSNPASAGSNVHCRANCQESASASSGDVSGYPNLFLQSLKLFETHPSNVQEEYNKFLRYQEQARAGTLFSLPMSRHMKVIIQVCKEMVVLAEVQQGLPHSFTEEELDFKSTMMARTLADLFAAVQDGKVTDVPALSTLKFMNSQLLQQSEDGALYMWSNGDEAASCVSQLDEFIAAARNVSVLDAFLSAYTAVVTDDMLALKARRLFEAWADETWWVKDARELTDEEHQRWHLLQLVTPDDIAIHLMASLDTDELVFVTERLTTPVNDVVSKWIHHPVVGPKMVDGSVLSSGIPEVWKVLYYLASRDQTGEFATMADMTRKQQLAAEQSKTL